MFAGRVSVVFSVNCLLASIFDFPSSSLKIFGVSVVLVASSVLSRPSLRRFGTSLVIFLEYCIFFVIHAVHRWVLFACALLIAAVWRHPVTPSAADIWKTAKLGILHQRTPTSCDDSRVAPTSPLHLRPSTTVVQTRLSLLFFLVYTACWCSFNLTYFKYAWYTHNEKNELKDLIERTKFSELQFNYTDFNEIVTAHRYGS